MASTAEFLAARTPRILWVELTSKCPADCIFCSRQMRRGAGRDLPFAVYSSLLDGLVDPRKFILNYSGESTVYPDLIPAIERARATGAFVELVSVLATAPESLLCPLSRSGLSRLTVSIHATDAEKFAEVYRYGSFATLHSRLERFLELCRAVPRPPVVDLAFVAMDTNLSQLSSVASLASALGLRDVTIFPVMRRDEIPAQFSSELTASGSHRPEFIKRLQAAVDGAAQSCPETRITVCGASSLKLPEGACIHSCEQNPWETTHVLSNGDVVACEALDRIPLGNLAGQSIDEIWHGAPYQRFREQYRRGEVLECRACPWKRAYCPGPRASEIVAARGLCAQLLYGWHEPCGEDHIWSSQQAAAVLAPQPGSRTLHVSGMLPPGAQNNPNHLTVSLNGTEIGRVTNPSGEVIPFGLDLPVAANQPEPWMLEFRSTHVYRPSERGAGSDQRDLGFALVLAAARRSVEQLYLDLLKKSLLGELYWENEVRLLYLRGCLEGRDEYSPGTLLRIDERRRAFCERYRELNRTGRLVDDLVENLGYQHSMIGRARLENVAACLESIRGADVPGDLIECGVWRGGTTVFMRGYLKAVGIMDRTVWVADSFAGPPPPSLLQDEGNDLSAAKYPMLAISLESVQDLFARYDLLDGQVRFLPGWFKDTLPRAPIDRLALLRIDGDLYESTWDALSTLYPKLSAGGFVIVDDYHCISACRQAVDEYRQREAITTPLESIDWTGVFWQKA